jgi:hypothetical protein
MKLHLWKYEPSPVPCTKTFDVYFLERDIRRTKRNSLWSLSSMHVARFSEEKLKTMF